MKMPRVRLRYWFWCLRHWRALRAVKRGIKAGIDEAFTEMQKEREACS